MNHTQLHSDWNKRNVEAYEWWNKIPNFEEFKFILQDKIQFFSS